MGRCRGPASLCASPHETRRRSHRWVTRGAGAPRFPHPARARRGVKTVRVRRLLGVKRGDFLPGFIQNICFRHYSSYLGYFLRVCSYGNQPSMKDLFTGPRDKERPYGVNLEGAPAPPPVSGPPSTTVLAPRGASTTSRVQPGAGMGAVGKVRWWVGFGELREGGDRLQQQLEVLQEDKDGEKVPTASV